MNGPHLLYEQATGLICGVDEQGLWFPLGEGYSGKPPFVNNPDAQNRAGLGPIPRGRYRVCEAFHHERLGPLSMRLRPVDGNEMFGRHAFLIHGDNKRGNSSASSGCIVLPRSVRETIAAQAPIDLIVVRGVDIAEDARAIMDNCPAPKETGAKQNSGSG